MKKMVKVIEVIAASEKSFDDAVRVAVAEAAKTVKNIHSVYVENMNVNVENNQIVSWAVNAKISFLLEEKE
jgi:dodecin